MSPDTNAYVAIPMDGMGIMSSSGSSVRRRHRSCVTETWLLGGVLAIVLLMLGIPLWMSHRHHSHHMMMGQNHMHGGWHEQKHHPYGSDTIVMVIVEDDDEQPVLDDYFLGEGVLDDEGPPDDDMLPVKDGSVTMYKGKPIVLVQEHGKIVEKYAEDPNDDEWFSDPYEEEPNDEVVDNDYENEDVLGLGTDGEDPTDKAIDGDDDYQHDQVIDEYVNEQPDEEFITDEVIYEYEEAILDESIDERYADTELYGDSLGRSSDSSSSSSSDSSDSNSSSSSNDEEYTVEELQESDDSFNELEEPIEEGAEEEVVAVERMGGN